MNLKINVNSIWNKAEPKFKKKLIIFSPKIFNNYNKSVKK